jgi:hypothetical protein
LLEHFSPGLLPLLQYSDPTTSPAKWIIRGELGLIVSIALGIFLFLQMKLSLVEKTFAQLKNRSTLAPNEAQKRAGELNNS